MATATDNCSDPEIDHVDGPISDGCPYSFERTWIATDACGNADSCIQVISVMDTIPPSIICPIDVNINCGDDEVPDYGTPEVGDNCDPDPFVDYLDGPINGDCPSFLHPLLDGNR